MSNLTPLLRHFPAVIHAFAYGSGVMHQPGLYDAQMPSIRPAVSTAAPMVDLIFAVEDARAWHRRVREGGSWSAL